MLVLPCFQVLVLNRSTERNIIEFVFFFQVLVLNRSTERNIIEFVVFFSLFLSYFYHRVQFPLYACTV